MQPPNIQAPGFQRVPVPLPEQMGRIVPQNWLEWIFSVYPPDQYLLQPAGYGARILAPAGVAGATGDVTALAPLFVFGISSFAVLTATGVVSAVAYSVGVQNATGNNWWGGQFMSPTVSGDAALAGAQVRYPWDLPREVAKDERVTFTVDNNIVAAAPALTVDCVIWGYEARKRNQPVQRQAASMPLR